jgi:Tfp pilus assembly protein PilF
MRNADRLDSWKEIASYLRRGLRTAQRWERDAGLPVRRVAGNAGAVYAFRAELDAWWQRRSFNGDGAAAPDTGMADAHGAATPDAAVPAPRPRVRPFLSHELRVDPDSAPGHADLAVYFFTLTMVGLMPPDEGLAAARGAAGRALQLDPDRAEAQAMLAVVAALYDRNWLEAERRWRLAFTREPVPAMVRFHYSPFFLEPLGRYVESLANLEPALAAEPLYLLGRVVRATGLFAIGRIDDALSEFEFVCRVDPQFAPAVGYLAREHAMAGRLDDARSFAERAYAAVPHHPNAVGMLAGILERTGDRDRARSILDAHGRERAWSLPRARAEAALACNQVDVAMDHMADAVAERDPGVWLMFAGSARPLLLATRRWPAVRAALNLPPAALSP